MRKFGPDTTHLLSEYHTKVESDKNVSKTEEHLGHVSCILTQAHLFILHNEFRVCWANTQVCSYSHSRCTSTLWTVSVFFLKCKIVQQKHHMGNGSSKYYHKWFAGVRNQKHIWKYSGLTDWVNYPCMTNGIEKDTSLWKKGLMGLEVIWMVQ